MSRKVKRTFSSLPYSLQRFGRKLSTAKPSSIVLAVIFMAIAVFLSGGGLYNLIVKPYPAIYYGGRFLFVYPQLSEQFVSDSIITMALFVMGTAGVLIIYQSTKYAYKPRQAYMIFLVGAALLIIAYISIEALLHYWKGV